MRIGLKIIWVFVVMSLISCEPGVYVNIYDLGFITSDYVRGGIKNSFITNFNSDSELVVLMVDSNTRVRNANIVPYGYQLIFNRKITKTEGIMFKTYVKYVNDKKNLTNVRVIEVEPILKYVIDIGGDNPVDVEPNQHGIFKGGFEIFIRNEVIVSGGNKDSIRLKYENIINREIINEDWY